MPSGFVYILASQRNGTLYTGVTGNLLDRMEQHQKNEGSYFARKYGVTRLVWFEEYPLYADAIRRDCDEAMEARMEIGPHRKAQSAVEGFTGSMECVTLDGRVKPAHGEIWK